MGALVTPETILLLIRPQLDSPLDKDKDLVLSLKVIGVLEHVWDTEDTLIR